MSDKPTLESVKRDAALARRHTDTKYADNFRLDARRVWWAHCEAVQSTVPVIPSFREFWNNEDTYDLIK